MTNTLFHKYQLLPNYDNWNSIILLAEDGTKKIITVANGRLVVETTSAETEKP
jgi:hypothetical protein